MINFRGFWNDFYTVASATLCCLIYGIGFKLYLAIIIVPFNYKLYQKTANKKIRNLEYDIPKIAFTAFNSKED